MNWPKLVLLALYVISALITVAQVGKPRKPLMPSAAVASLVVTGVLCWLVVIA